LKELRLSIEKVLPSTGISTPKNVHVQALTNTNEH
jgi:hypothetical protein